jgi:hypothetical protein
MPAPMMIEIHGAVKSISDWAKFYNRPKSTARRRMKQGMTPLEAFTTKSFNTGYLTVNNERRTIQAWIKRAGISRCTLSWRLAQGWSLEDAVSPPKKRTAKLTAFGVTQSLRAHCRDHNAKYRTVHWRMVEIGLTLEQALTMPVKRGKT